MYYFGLKKLSWPQIDTNIHELLQGPKAGALAMGK